MMMIPMSRFTQITAPVILLGLLFFSCKKQDEAPQPEVASASADLRIVATVNGDPITLGEFRERYHRSGLKPEKEVEAQVKEEFLHQLIERKMLLREAQRRRIKVSLPEINKRIEAYKIQNGKNAKDILASMGIDYEKWKADVWEDIMIEKLLERDVNRKLAVSWNEIRKYYQQHPEEFERPEQVRASQIVMTTEAEAQRALELLQGGEDFAAVAKEKSTAPEAAQGGDLGYFAMGDMPAEFNVVFGLSKGGISGVVKSPYGYHLFKLEDRRKAGMISLDDAASDIREKLLRAKEQNRHHQWLSELRSRTKFVVNYQALQ